MQIKNIDKYIYDENGYIYAPNLIETKLIDNLLHHYQQKILVSNYPFFRQNTNRYEPHRLNKFGYMTNPLLDIHDYQKFPEFSNVVKDILCSDSMQQKLLQITGAESVKLVLTMLFDANPGTTPHQDWWYADSVPNGYLVGSWIALEDIDEKAGRFYVLPKSHQHPDFQSNVSQLSNRAWKQKNQDFVDANFEKIYAPAMKRGDVIFWNSRTIHAALPNLDSRYSRKSLTAHFIPSQYDFGNLFKKKDYITYKEYQGIQYYKSQPDYSWMNAVKYRGKMMIFNYPPLLKLLRRFQGWLIK